MNHRPYPRVDRSLEQVVRGRVPEPPRCPICNHPVNRHALDEGQRVCTRGQGLISCRDCAEVWARTPALAGILNFGILWRHGAGRQVLVEHPQRSGKAAIIAAIVDEAVKAGHHVHVASRERAPLFGAASNATTFSRAVGRAGVAAESAEAHSHAAGRCLGCGHDPHPSGTACDSRVDHGLKRWHRCLCLATDAASTACPPQMDCQGGTLGWGDIRHLRQGRNLSGLNGEIITPAVLAERPAIVLARVVRTCEAVPSQWDAWTTRGQYLYLRYRSGIGTVDAYPSADYEKWKAIPVGAVARFDTEDRLDGEMAIPEFCERAGLQLAEDAEVIGE
ncbi:hypothetical protein ACFYRN_24995 [Streptomyces sp. NPDC005227]|uniref:hypothetical protein n=1 Tax=Streptomyces sp. NPDC005227 TaxID=3364707 RepID=UPI0036928BB6